MTLFNEIIELLKTGEWYARETHYENGDFSVYAICKDVNENERTVHCTVNIGAIRQLKTHVKFRIVPATSKTVCLNFTPKRIGKGMASVLTA